ncbi:phosphopantothenoylcysteine decarboxylase subunit VHS3-like [Phragmites australis]|uniref:phosphopantothenoylcysteine decarboxylase subunit VHS3-like n=1 Tax=Phragmites australis TaxID=29695 RepID=UPI002D772A01|nr:phosphopantothenoylcysteine decarboxylase subunit VHS3-like [Phragmites australis]
MAGYTPNYGAGGPGNARPTYRSYSDYMSSTFVDHFESLPARLNAEERPRPLDAQRYYDEYDSDQSNTCAKLAVEFYSQQQGNSPIMLHEAKGSHKFFSNRTAYFHVNFKAGGYDEPYDTFFAEVMGPGGGPETVTMVVRFRTKGDGGQEDGRGDGHAEEEQQQGDDSDGDAEEQEGSDDDTEEDYSEDDDTEEDYGDDDDTEEDDDGDDEDGN